MKAAYIEEHGELDKIKIGELEPKKIGPNDVLVKAQYAALNHLDIFVIKGWSGLNLSMPHVIGADGSGIIEEIGSKVSTVCVGDRVSINPGLSCGKCKSCLAGQQVFCKNFSITGEHQWGTFAEFFKVPEINIMRVPKNFPMDKAAAAPLTFLTAYRMLMTQAKLKPDEIVFIHGAGGGVASAAIQIAKYYGAKVITTTSSPEKEKKAIEIGADHVINYKKKEDYSRYVYTELTDKKGIDIIIDSIGKETFPISIRLLRPGGRLVTCGVTSGPDTEIDIRNIFWKQLEIKGSTMANQEEFRRVMEIVFNEKVEPIIDRTFSIEQAREAEEYLNKGTQFGKVLIKI